VQNNHPIVAQGRRRNTGFTIVEVLIAVVVIAVLAAVALPGYQSTIRKGKRSEAFAALSALQQAQERWRGNNSAYTTTLANTAAADAPPNGLGVAANTSSGLYAVSVTDPSSTGYTALATAVAGTSQASDGNCKVLGVRIAAGNVKYGSAADAIDWAAANADTGSCWAK
jgi:type IV pilus assembly protein PilE